MKKLLLVLAVMFSAYAGFAQDDKNADSIKAQIDNKSFVFIARSALPLRGSMISLSPTYDVQVSSDTVRAYLPYYGKAHTAVYPGDETAIKFTSLKSDYTVKATKHGWNVTIKPKDVPNSVTMNFNISKSGNVLLHVSDYKRDAITFHGYID
ncbi:MAG: DUF4251 domain-containing protein [Prevotellaceae bacterium]|jgi:hypothetical protein|nr:DUF4251 domain-containing protein [Prevotellaceae bacterium]